MPSKQYLKDVGESYPDVTRFDDFGPEPTDAENADSRTAARYAADCHTRQVQHNQKALERGEPEKQRNMKQTTGQM
jgi:hypothetical protein